MLIRGLALGAYRTNCWLVADKDTLRAAVIDPGFQGSTILKAIEDAKLKVEYILLTHGHFDHTGAVAEIHAATGAPIYIHRNEVDVAARMGQPLFPGLPAGTEIHWLSEGDTLPLGGLTIEVMVTPGHSTGSCVFRVGSALFTGDTLFCDSCGRTDFPGGSFSEMMLSLKRLHDLPGDYDVFPGHEESTTLEAERCGNAYMRRAEFLAQKEQGK